MNSEKMLKEFIEKVRAGEQSFEVIDKEEGNYCYFMRRKVGDCDFIYAIRTWSENRKGDINESPQMIAITNGIKVYIIDLCVFGIYTLSHFNFPENVEMLSAADENKYVQEVLLPLYVDTLPTEERKNDKGEYLRYDIEKAREIVLANEKLSDIKPSLGDVFTRQDIVNILCGFIDFDKEVQRHFEEERNDLIIEKSRCEAIKELLSSNTVAEPWEHILANSIKDLQAQAVLVEFEMNGKTASAKIAPRKILTNLIKNEYFNTYSFLTIKSGEELIEELGATDYCYVKDNKPKLYCKNISKITFRGKDVYVR